MVTKHLVKMHVQSKVEPKTEEKSSLVVKNMKFKKDGLNHKFAKKKN